VNFTVIDGGDGYFGVKVFGNPILGFRTSEGANFVNFFEESELMRLELRKRMMKEREDRGL